MADVFTWVVRFLHIFSGVMWVGGAFLWGMVVAPSVMQRGPPMIRRPFLEAVLAKMTRYMIIAGSLTILSGFWVMGLIVGWDGISEAFQIPGYGLALGIGAIAAIAMYVEGWLVIKPTGEKLLKCMQAMPAPVPGAPNEGPSPAGAGSSPAPPAEIPALGKKLGIAGLTSMLLGAVALGAMVWAVNVVR